MNRNGISVAYFNWMCDIVCPDRTSPGSEYSMLLEYLYDVEFVYTIPRDENRAMNGIDLRYRYAYEQIGYDEAERYLYGPCSVLEMMVALALRMEEDIMTNPAYGDRTAQWFWNMLVSLGLGSMRDDAFDTEYVDEAISRFLHREYEPNGKGGLFTVRHCDRDLRQEEIWIQMCLYLDGLT